MQPGVSERDFQGNQFVLIFHKFWWWRRSLYFHTNGTCQNEHWLPEKQWIPLNVPNFTHSKITFLLNNLEVWEAFPLFIASSLYKMALTTKITHLQIDAKNLSRNVRYVEKHVSTVAAVSCYQKVGQNWWDGAKCGAVLEKRTVKSRAGQLIGFW